MRIVSFLLVVIACMAASFNVQAQNILETLENRKPGEGKVIIHQDPRLAALLTAGRDALVEETKIDDGSGQTVAADEPTPKRVFKTTGYRVQVYVGNNSRQGREEAMQRASKVKEVVSGISIYTYFDPPRWLCRVGDFKSVEEADVVMRKLKTVSLFKEASVVRDQINIKM